MWNIHYHQKGTEMLQSLFTRIMLAITIGWVLAGCTVRILNFGTEKSSEVRTNSIGSANIQDKDTE